MSDNLDKLSVMTSFNCKIFKFLFQDDDNEGIQVTNEMANRMSLFYAYPTPLLKTLSDATSKFVTEVHVRRVYNS